MSITLEEYFRGKVRKNPIAEIYCNGDKLTLYEHEKGELILEGRFGEIGGRENHTHIQQVVHDLQTISGDDVPTRQMIEDIRQRKMYVEMEQLAKRLLHEEFRSIKKEVRSPTISGSEEPPIFDLDRKVCKPFRAIYQKNEDIDAMQYPDAAYWAYVTGVGVYFGPDEKREDMRKEAIAELRALC